MAAVDGQPEDRLQTLSEVIEAADARLREGVTAAGRVWPTGFRGLDTYLGGGLRSGELSLVSGPQGLGKSTFVLQVARNAVVAGRTAVYFSFEHPPAIALERLVAIEAAEKVGLDGVPLRRVREALEAADGQVGGLEQRLAGTTGGSAAVRAVHDYAGRLLVHRSSGAETGLAAVRAVVKETRERTGQGPLVVVDYLQKVPVADGPGLEEERVTVVVEGLKDLALEEEVAVLAVAAADMEGLSGRRLRVHHLRGSSALAYESDVVLIINDKYDVVARHHLVYDVAKAERYHNWVVLSIEKNRSGMDGIDLEMRKRFDQGRFDTDADLVGEQLVDERVHIE